MNRDPLNALSALGDATRRRLYDHVAREADPVSRDEAAAAAGVGRTLAAYHLDRLVADGLLTVAYERRSGRTGPGAGRPAKVYARAEDEIAVSVPPRDYHVAARLLADAAAADTEGHTRQALSAAAERLGHEIAEEADPAAELEALLRERGYEPMRDERGDVRLRNCPFHAVARRHPEVVCEMNLALLRGLVEGLEAPGITAMLEPEPGHCCVALRHAGGERRSRSAGRR
jgi:predicted ArsR family transcriptional regulator